MVQAIDCATKLTAPMLDKFVKLGVKIFGRYLPTRAWKGLTIEEVKLITQYGGKIFSIYEDNADHLGYFTEKQGIYDAKKGEKMARDLGQPKGEPIYYTVDFNVKRKEFPVILKYFQAIKDNLKDYKVRPYGHDAIVDYLIQHGICDKGYQTYAWSGGRRSNNAVIYQYSNGERMAGIPVDYDKVSGDIGAWHYVEAKKPEIKKESLVDYRIKKGDNLTKLAKEYNTTVDYLVKVNHIKNPNLIVTGHTIKVPGESKHNVYIVKKDDNLTKIAKEFNTTVDRLVKLNNIKNKNLIYPGQKIKY